MNSADEQRLRRKIVKLLDSANIYEDEGMVPDDDPLVMQLIKVGYNQAVRDMQQSMRSMTLPED